MRRGPDSLPQQTVGALFIGIDRDRRLLCQRMFVFLPTFFLALVP